MSRKNYIIIGAVAIIFIAIIIGKNRGEDLLQVNVDQPALRTITSTVSANGKIRPEAEIKISPDISGEIIALYVAEGDTVEEGELLLKINPDLYVTARDRASAGLSSAQSNLKTAQAGLTQTLARHQEQESLFKRNRLLHRDGVLSDAEFDAIRTAYQVSLSEIKAAEERVSAAEFGIDNARASLNEAQKNISRTSIYAPTSGIVSALNNEKGERVVGTAQMAGTEIMVISNFNNMEVIVEVNENDILEINKNDTALIEVDAYNNRRFKGIVTEIASSAKKVKGMELSADQVTNFEVKIRLLKQSYTDLLEVTQTPFLPGMSANVEIETEKKKDILCLPIEAVSTRLKPDSLRTEEDDIDEVIFVLQDGKAVKRIVQTGIQDTRYIEVTEGLDEEETVIVGPYEAVSKKLRDDMAVEKTSKEALSEEEEE